MTADERAKFYCKVMNLYFENNCDSKLLYDLTQTGWQFINRSFEHPNKKELLKKIGKIEKKYNLNDSKVTPEYYFECLKNEVNI